MTDGSSRTPARLKRCWNLLEFHFRGTAPDDSSRPALREKTRKCFETYIRRFGAHPRALYGLGLLWYYSQEVPDSIARAEELIRAAVRADPHDSWSRMTLSIICFDRANYSEALAHAGETDRTIFLEDPSVAWRALKLEEVELASRALLGREVADDEWRLLISTYRLHASQPPGPSYYPREGILAARETGRSWVADALTSTWKSSIRKQDDL